MKKIGFASLILALAGCATTPMTPEQQAAQQDTAMRLMLMGSFMQQAFPQPTVIHCLGCR